ncbi:unnamed protein product [Lymnaea stagnalis]|uniref:Ion transport domain-containing protein n=1 Tax=Lymnaea stagnalis TaxID=6523 RepID=A0AAV2I9G5_LYMST
MLENFYAFKKLGPVWIMITKMMEVTMPFLMILLVFFIAYAISSESLLYPETQISGPFFFNLFRKGFWAMFGEFLLEELEVKGSDCTKNYSSYTDFETLRCPTEYGRYVVPILLGIYIIFVQILLFNLLISLFNSIISKTGSKRNSYWTYQKFQQTFKYTISLFPLPPMTFVYFLLKKNSPYLSKSLFSRGIYIDPKFKETKAKQYLKDINNEERYLRKLKVKQSEEYSVEFIRNVVENLQR